MTARENEVQLFNRGERVLCYEPDESKARVLYVSKVLAVYERKDDAKCTYFEYKIHFQGWSSSWDRNVRAACLLKDNEENRKLQRELADDAQLQKSGGYTYKDTKTPTLPAGKKQRLTRGGHLEEQSADPLNITPEQTQTQSHKKAARDTSGGRKAQGETADANPMRETRKATRGGGRKGGKSLFSMRTPPKEAAHNNNATQEEAKLMNQENRVMLRISERLRGYMEYDYNMISMLGKQHALPSRMPIVSILESFVKQRAVELAIGIKQDSSRGRITTSRNARMEREYDRVMSIVCMLKEVVDGLRIYFEFHLEDHLLYKEEKDYALSQLTDENLKNCSTMLNNAFVCVNPELELISHNSAVNGLSDENEHVFGCFEYKKQRDKYLEYIVKNSGKNSMALAYDVRHSPYQAADKLPFEMYGFLCETFNWRLLSAESRPEKSMMFGAPHLARLLVKLPEYLNVSPISNEKLEDLLKHLNSFIK
ncbi:hypothetical protein KR093_010982 [Drosophila rubida]|uniref:Protein male-specific lethal-3 n=1 Tax=Drosophila rubida TaxID=30044 RepID=A0AAD4JWY2_9MUSC|nr:hypothetical protein KR093_010982 [Drosophila rubida]